MTDLQSRIGASEGVSMVGTQFDGQIPPGETPAAAGGSCFRDCAGGKPFSDKDGVGPKFSRNGLDVESVKEAGSKWPLASANTQALNRKWVVPIEPGQEKPGDLVFWRLNNATDLPGRIDHVGARGEPGQGSVRSCLVAQNWRRTQQLQVEQLLPGPAMFGRIVDAPKSAAKKS